MKKISKRCKKKDVLKIDLNGGYYVKCYDEIEEGTTVFKIAKDGVIIAVNKTCCEHKLK